MTTRKAAVLVNARKMPMDRTLGVALYVLSLAKALSQRVTVFVGVPDVQAAQRSPYGALFEDGSLELVHLDSAADLMSQFTLIELCPHHFQPPEFSRLSILICHDLHIFDVPWKYPNVEAVQQQFIANLRCASIVVSEFPRTYYEVERKVGKLQNLYLLDSPLLLDTAPAADIIPSEPPNILYPAQLQKHKNHLGLLAGFKSYKERGGTAVLKFTGTDFGPAESQEIKGFITQNSLEDDVLTVGRLSNEEMIVAYGDAAAVIVPSLAEGGAYVVLEAVMARRPVAVNDIPSARAHLRQFSVNCSLFNAEDPVAIAEVIEELMRVNKSAVASANEEARARISRTTWEGAASKLESLIGYLLGQCAKPVMTCDHVSWNSSY